jgi:hypothetical protein
MLSSTTEDGFYAARTTKQQQNIDFLKLKLILCFQLWAQRHFYGATVCIYWILNQNIAFYHFGFISWYSHAVISFNNNVRKLCFISK